MLSVFKMNIEMPSTKLLCNILGSNSINSEDSSVLEFYSVLTGKQLLELWRSSVFIFKVRQSKIFFQYAANYCLLLKKKTFQRPWIVQYCIIFATQLVTLQQSLSFL
jgi:hypothetical protein